MSESNRSIRLPESWAADWVLDRALGSGAFSTVYRAVRRDRPSVETAIKIISVPGSDAELAALRAEGMDAAQSQSWFDAIAREYTSEIDLMEDLKGSPNIVGIEDYKVIRKPDGIGNNIFIRMELLKPLDAVLRQRELSEQEVLRLGVDICSALELCASRQIIHRDIKPANIFVNDKMPERVYFKLGDFGVARSMQAITHTLSKKGTPNYMAPEIFNSKNYDARADLYSLGITLYRLLNNNQLPFTTPGELTPASREAALSRRLSGEQLPPPGSCSRAAAQAVLKACEFYPEDRYANAREMRLALEALLRGKDSGRRETYDTGEETVPVIPREEQPKKEKAKKNPALIAALCVCALLVVAAAAILLSRAGKKPEELQEIPAAVTEAVTEEPTEEPTAEPAPTSEPAAAPVPVQVGEIVKFGRYEQDDNLENGQESIEWIVLDVQDGKALLLSRYGLDAKPYNTELADVTWETCTLRTWLNGDFLNAAFAEKEQAAILLTDVDNSREQGSSEWDTDGGNDTEDKIFLLSNAEANRHLGVIWGNNENTQARVSPTAYAVRNGVRTDSNCKTAEGDAAGWWWLRSPGFIQNFAAFVSCDGSLNFDCVHYDYGCVRPVLWVSLESGMIVSTGEKAPFADEIGPAGDASSAAVNAVPAADENLKETEQGESGISPLQEFRTVGNIVKFGHYEQDNNLENGQEPIEWIVLDVQDGKALLLSKYGLDAKPYNEELKNDKVSAYNWAYCTLRAWLNEDFLNTAFSADEKSALLMTDVNNRKTEGYTAWDYYGTINTQDKVFLLSYAEANRYLEVTDGNNSNMKSRVKPTAWAIKNGAHTSSGYKTAEGDATGWWWLRSPGYRIDSAASVYDDGSLYIYNVRDANGCVRPAFWLNLESDIFSDYGAASVVSEASTPQEESSASLSQYRLVRADDPERKDVWTDKTATNINGYIFYKIEVEPGVLYEFELPEGATLVDRKNDPVSRQLFRYTTDPALWLYVIHDDPAIEDIKILVSSRE